MKNQFIMCKSAWCENARQIIHVNISQLNANPLPKPS